MKDSFEKRMRVARVLLLIALGVYVGAQFFPWSPYSSPEPLGSLWGLMWETVTGLAKGRFDVVEFMFIVIYGGLAVVMLVAPFTTRFLGQGRALLWVLRVLMGVMTGWFSYVVIGLYMRPSQYMAPGGLLPMFALWFHVAGLFVIPRRRRVLSE